MLARFPTDDARLAKTVVDKQLLRLGIIAELDAIDLYEQLAAATSDKKIKAAMLDIAREEKTHVGEFLALLLAIRPSCSVQFIEHSRRNAVRSADFQDGELAKLNKLSVGRGHLQLVVLDAIP